MKKISNSDTAARIIIHAQWYLFYTRGGDPTAIRSEELILALAWLKIINPKRYDTLEYSKRSAASISIRV